MFATQKDVSVTRAREHEAPACLALLPEIGSAPAEFLIARKDGKFAGAAAVIWANGAEPAGFSIHARVLKFAQRQGVGRELITAAEGIAERETDGLWSLQATPVESPAAKFLEACGFAPRKREHYFKVGVEQLLANIGPIAERYRARRRIPDGAEIVSLAETAVPLNEIAWLIAREFSGSPLVNIQSLRRCREDSADGSMVALFDGELAGVLLWRRQDDVAIVDVRVVSSQWRSGWPNVMLLETALLRGHAEGLRQIKFYSDETIGDTLKLARRGEGDEVDLKARYYLAFR